MLIRRIVMFIISMIIGIIIQYGVVIILKTNVEEMGLLEFFLPSAFFWGLGVAIWMDLFMKTDILKH